MEEKRELTKQLFKNYLREFYVEASPEELKWAKEEISRIKENSWNMILYNQRKVKVLMSYYLVAKKCPEYRVLTSVDLIENRFSEEETTKDLIFYNGILILRHSSTFVRNKLMFETMLNIVAERAYRCKPIIVLSDIVKDEGGYLYYSQEIIQRYIPSILSRTSTNTSFGSNSSTDSDSMVKSEGRILHKTNKTSAVRGTSKPLANRNLKEVKMNERVKAIEEGARNAV